MWVRQEEEIAQPFICQLLLPFVSHLLFHLPPKTEGLKHAKIPNNDRILFWERYEDFQFFTDSLNLVRDFGHFSGPWVSFILTPKPIFGFSYLWWLKRVPTQFKKSFLPLSFRPLLNVLQLTYRPGEKLTHLLCPKLCSIKSTLR